MFYELSAEFDKLADLLVSFGYKQEDVDKVLAYLLHELRLNLENLRK